MKFETAEFGPGFSYQAKNCVTIFSCNVAKMCVKIS